MLIATAVSSTINVEHLSVNHRGVVVIDKKFQLQHR